MSVFLKIVVTVISCALLLHNTGNAKSLEKGVSIYPIECGELFACPDSILPRVSFWIEVFSRWDTSTAVFHDKNNPERVYSTLKRNQGCRKSRKGDAIDRERKKIKRQLETLAYKVQQGQKLTNQESERLRLFGEQANRRVILDASKNIRCQSGNRDRMRQALQNFKQYQPMILDALESQNLTQELQYLPFVESAFNPNALSHLGAAGMWQIMPNTAKSLGLELGYRVDERYDPRRSSYAAAKYFRQSVDKLTSVANEVGHPVAAKNLNPFVITSYNYGVRGMERAIRQVGLNYERLLKEYKSPSFQVAVKNFYASFLAARYVAKNSNRFFGELRNDNSQQIFDYQTVNIPRKTSIKRLVKYSGVSREQLKKLNPSLRKIVWQNKALVPKNFAFRLPYKPQGWSALMGEISSLPSEYERAGYLWHKVRRGETACSIAKKYATSCRALKNLNKLNRRATIYAGKKIKVPTGNAGIHSRSAKQSQTTYRVRKGDTPCGIAKKLNMSCNQLLAMNGLRRSSVIRVNQKLYIQTKPLKAKKHTVRKGQTVCGIARLYRVSCSQLLKVNRLNKKSIIRAGQKLALP